MVMAGEMFSGEIILVVKTYMQLIQYNKKNMPK